MTVNPGDVAKVRQWCLTHFYRVPSTCGENVANWHPEYFYVSSETYENSCIILDRSNFVVGGFQWTLIDVMMYDGRIALIPDGYVEKI